MMLKASSSTTTTTFLTPNERGNQKAWIERVAPDGFLSDNIELRGYNDENDDDVDVVVPNHATTLSPKRRRAGERSRCGVVKACPRAPRHGPSMPLVALFDIPHFDLSATLGNTTTTLEEGTGKGGKGTTAAGTNSSNEHNTGVNTSNSVMNSYKDNAMYSFLLKNNTHNTHHRSPSSSSLIRNGAGPPNQQNNEQNNNNNSEDTNLIGVSTRKVHESPFFEEGNPTREDIA